MREKVPKNAQKKSALRALKIFYLKKWPHV